MNREQLSKYKKNKRDIENLDGIIAKLQERLDAVPVVSGKVTKSSDEFPYIEEHVQVRVEEPKAATALKMRIHEKEKRKDQLIRENEKVEKYITAMPDGTTKDIFEMVPKYLPIFNNRTVKHIILTSGRAGTKSSYAAIRTDYQIVSDPHGSAVVLRKHHNKLRKTVYKEMIRGINRLGISKNKFTITKSPMEITYKKYGTTIYFSGSDGIDDTKGIIDEDKPIKLVVLDELTRNQS